MHTLNVRGLTGFTLMLLTALAVSTGGAAAAPAAPPGAAAEAAPPVSEFPEVGPGARGDAVRIAQRLLAYHGYPTAPDGIFGPKTGQRTQDFQADRGIPMTGTVDVETWEWLVVEVGRGDRGEPVRSTQWLLRRFGQPVVVDGIFGPRTEAATRAFRKAHGLPATGVVDVETWRTMLGNL